MTTPRVLVILAEGAEEMETVITVDVLRRAGIEVVMAGLEGYEPVRCSRGVRIVPDVALSELRSTRAGTGFDALVLPGGAGGAQRLAGDPEVGELLREQAAGGGLIAAICAAPQVLVAHGVHAGRQMACHPAVREAVSAHGAHVEAAVVEDGALITSQGPGTALAFAFALVRRLKGQAELERVRAPMMLSDAT